MCSRFGLSLCSLCSLCFKSRWPCRELRVVRNDVVLGDLRDRRGAGLLHHDLELVSQQRQDGLDTFLPERRQAPDVWAADADCGGAERVGLEDVGAAAETAVDDHDAASADAG